MRRVGFVCFGEQSVLLTAIARFFNATQDFFCIFGPIKKFILVYVIALSFGDVISALAQGDYSFLCSGHY